MIILALAGVAACGGDPAAPDPADPANVPPTIGAVADQGVVLNTLAVASIAVELQIVDPDDDSFSVLAASDAPTVIAETEVTCGAGPCRLTLSPQTTTPASVVVTVTVSDGSGGEASTSFVVDVSPRLVTSVADAGPGSLPAVIAMSEEGDVIGFDSGGAFGGPATVALDAQLVLDRTLTIVGPGTAALTVSGNGAVRPFRIQGGADVALENLTVADGVAPLESLPSGDVRLGGCLLVDAGSRLVLDGVRVAGCAAPADVDLSAGGGVANLDGTLLVRSSQIQGNSAGRGGGVASIDLGESAATTIEDSRVSGNSADSQGGGVYNTGTLDIIAESALFENEVVGTGAFEGGGGLFNAGAATIADSRVSENSGHDGGGVFNDADAVLTLRTVSVLANQADAGGGGIFTRGEIAVESSSIRGNQAVDRGGGIDFFAGPGGTVSQTVVQGNGAAFGAGVNLGEARDAIVSIVDSQILENVAGEVGGGLLVGASRAPLEAVNVSGTTIAGNRAKDGGGIAVRGGGLLVVRSAEIAENVATRDGGGVYLADFEDAEFRETRITGNRAMGGGGIIALAADDQRARLAIQDASSIRENVATLGGGGIAGSSTATLVSALSVLIQNSEVSDNDAGAGIGGGVYLYRGLLVLFDGGTAGGVKVERNEAETGGGIWARGADVQIHQPSVLVANRAARDGGGIYVSGTTLTVDGTSCVILGNVADADGDGIGMGGGIYADGTSDLTGVPSTRVCLNDPDDIAM